MESSRRGFDANERAQVRETGPVTLGGITYHPARLTNKRLRDVRRLGRKSEIDSKTVGRETVEYREAYDQAITDGIENTKAIAAGDAAASDSDAVSDVNLASLATQLHLLLVDDAMQPPSEQTMRQHLDEDIDARDVGALMTYLVGADEPDPTPAQTGTSTSSAP